MPATPYLYILMRIDLASMNAGKAVAQGSHATNLFEDFMKSSPETDSRHQLYREWKESAGGFGVCITLGCDERQLRGAIEYGTRCGIPCGITHDPTYPLMDGDFLHLIPLDTCGWMFGDKAELSWLLNDLNLMK